MGVEYVSQLGGAALSGSLLPWVFSSLWRRIRRDPKAEAEARNLNVQADGKIITRLYAEIDRLDREVSELRDQLATERRECAEQMASMQGHIRQLQQQQTSFGNMGDSKIDGPLRMAFPPIDSDKDDDLLGKLNRVPSRRKGRRQ